jgi:hypothetical protein
MMKRVLIVVALAALVTTELQAGFSFCQCLRKQCPPATPMELVHRILEQPEKVVKVYGPSILNLQPMTNTNRTKHTHAK